MCYAVPARIVSVEGNHAVVEHAGISKTVNVSLVKDPIKDDWVLVHAGFAIEKLDAKSAAETLDIYRQMGEQIGR